MIWRLHHHFRRSSFLGRWGPSGATIKRTILLPGSSVGEGAYLEDCIVGHGYDARAGKRIRGVTLVRGAIRKERKPAAAYGIGRAKCRTVETEERS